MGLDITAYSNLVELTDPATEYQGITLYIQNDAFPGRADEFNELNNYDSSDDTFGFRAGSYSGYNRWREQLTTLAELGTPQNIWDNPNLSGPFVELINFSDCKGTIGTAVSKKLAKDFKKFKEKAKQHPDEWFRKLYTNWMKAFKKASKNGAVIFH